MRALTPEERDLLGGHAPVRCLPAAAAIGACPPPRPGFVGGASLEDGPFL